MANKVNKQLQEEHEKRKKCIEKLITQSSSRERIHSVIGTIQKRSVSKKSRNDEL